MADTKWTDAQINAISAHGGTVLVSAAAGSGKTAVLVERVIRMITDEKNPCSVDEMLIVTFTKAAAAQMKDKISRAISAKIAEENDWSIKNYLIKQQMLLKCAKISTIDSFCSDIVKQNMQSLEIDSSYKLLDEDTMRVIMDEAYEETAEEFYAEGDPSFLLLADMFTKSNDDKLLKELVMTLHSFAISYRNPKKRIEDIDRKFRNDKTDFTNEYAVTVFENFRQMLVYFKNLARHAYSISLEDERVSSTYGVSVSNDIQAIDELILKMPENFSAEDFDEFTDAALSFSFERIKTIKKDAKSELSESVKIIRDYYKDEFKKSLKTLGIKSADNKSDVEKLSSVMRMLSRFTLAFFERFDKMKKEKNCADFSDILHMALSLLVTEENGVKKKTELALEYAEQYREILIDEYQDTNEAQDDLFWAVSRDGKNQFFVGDVKQSIYGFRKAMPKIFIEKRKAFAEYDKQNVSFPATVSLDKNFRSRSEVTDFVNYVFEFLMSEEAGEVEYDEREKLKCGASYPQRENMQTEIHIIENEFDEDGAVLQARHIANEILKLKENREFDFSDVAVLIRTNKNIPTFVRVLCEMGVSAYADESESLFETDEIRTVFSLLKVIDNPARDVPLLAAMMSPIYAFSADELAEIRAFQKQGSFYEAVKKKADTGDEKCRKFLDELSSFRLLSQTVTPGELLRHILASTGYRSVVLSLDGGERRSENLDIFRAFADSYSETNDVGLSGFVRHLEKTERSKSVKSASESKSGKAVAVMSIHRSKGLEFPVCFITECERAFSKRSLSNDLLAHPEAGVGIIGIEPERMIKYETLSHTALKISREKSEMSEEMRVLYVALTRAKEKLFIVASAQSFEKALQRAAIHSLGKKAEPVAVRSASNYLDWILSACLRHPDALWLRLKVEMLAGEKVGADFPLEIKLIENVPETEKTAEISEKEDACDEEYLNEIRKRVNFVYPYLPLSNALAKRGASTAFKEHIDREFFASERPAFLNKTSLSAAGRGTAMHTFMQFANYENAKDNLEDEISLLCKKGYLTDIEAESLDRKKLNRFFQSNLYLRVCKSEKVYREKKFILGMSPCEFDENLGAEFSDERVIVQGIFDCAFEENGEIVIIDYKTDRVSSAEVLRERYSGQLRIYERAVRECLGKNVKETLLYSFCLDTTVKI